MYLAGSKSTSRIEKKKVFKRGVALIVFSSKISMGFAFILLATLAIATSLIHAQGTDAAAAEIAAAATSQEPEIFEYMMMYGYNPPRQNDAYCKGFHIDYPATPGLTFEANSHQYIKWSIDQDMYYGDHPPEVVYRARIMSSGQLNYHIIGGDIRKCVLIYICLGVGY